MAKVKTADQSARFDAQIRAAARNWESKRAFLSRLSPAMWEQFFVELVTERCRAKGNKFFGYGTISAEDAASEIVAAELESVRGIITRRQDVCERMAEIQAKVNLCIRPGYWVFADKGKSNCNDGASSVADAKAYAVAMAEVAAAKTQEEFDMAASKAESIRWKASLNLEQNFRSTEGGNASGATAVQDAVAGNGALLEDDFMVREVIMAFLKSLTPAELEYVNILDTQVTEWDYKRVKSATQPKSAYKEVFGKESNGNIRAKFHEGIAAKAEAAGLTPELVAGMRKQRGLSLLWEKTAHQGQSARSPWNK